MGAFLIRGGATEVAVSVRRALESLGFCDSAVPNEGTSPVPVIIGHTPSWFDRIETRLVLEPHGDTTLVTATFGSGLCLRIRLLFLIVVFLSITFLIVTFPDETIVAVRTALSAAVASAIICVVNPGKGTPLTEVPHCYWVLGAAVIGLVPFGMALAKAEKTTSTILARQETNFWEQIRKDFPLRLISPARHRPLPTTYLILTVSALVAAGGLFLCKIHPLVLLCALPFLAFLWLLSLLPHFFDHKPWLSTRLISASGASRTSLLNFLVLFLFAMGFGLTAAHQLNQNTDDSPGIKPFTELRDRLVNRNPLLDDVRSGEERTRQLLTQAEHWTQKTIERSPQTEQYNQLLRSVFLLVPAGALGVAILVLFTVGFRLYWQEVTGIPESWQERVAQNSADWIRLPSAIESRGLRGFSFRMPFMLLFILGAMINLLALLAALDLFWILMSDHALLFPQSECLVSWFFVPFLSLGMLKEPADVHGWDLVARIVLLAIVLPPLYVWGRRTLGIGADWFRGIGLALGLARRRLTISQELRTTLTELCRNTNLPVPRLRILRRGTVFLCLRTGLVARRPILLISTGALSRLTEPEMKAAIAHELGHANQNLGRFRWLRIASILGGYPPWFLLLLTDFRQLEEDADRFALQAGAEPQHLASAIIKASSVEPSESSGLTAILSRWIDRHAPHKMRDPLLKALRSGLVLDRFLFSDDLVASSHPLPRDRIAAIFARAD